MPGGRAAGCESAFGPWSRDGVPKVVAGAKSLSRTDAIGSRAKAQARRALRSLPKDWAEARASSASRLQSLPCGLASFGGLQRFEPVGGGPVLRMEFSVHGHGNAVLAMEETSMKWMSTYLIGYFILL